MNQFALLQNQLAQMQNKFDQMDKNIAKKFLKKALSQTEGILGNDTIHKLNADIFENLGVIYELMNRFNDSLIFYKKSFLIT